MYFKKIGAVWRKKARPLGKLTCFKQALEIMQHIHQLANHHIRF